MSYKVIGKRKLILVENTTNQRDCDLCCISESKCIRNGSICIGQHKYYIPDSEVEKLESENDLKAKNEALQIRIKELEEEKTTETKIEIQQIKKLNFHVEKTFCCNFIVRSTHKFCPNCGRKIIRK